MDNAVRDRSKMEGVAAAERDRDKNSPRPVAILGGNKERWPPPMFSRFLVSFLHP